MTIVQVDTDRRAANRYFTAFLPSILGRLMIENLRTLDAVFEIRLTDQPDAAWCMVVELGRLVFVGQDGPAPACRFALDTATLLDIVRGELAPQDAFFAMRVEIDDDVELGLKLSTVLECFFQRFPFQEGAE
jgi:predicted lipid carrier protein YhbT